MLYREIIAVCSEIHTKHINRRCGRGIGFLNVNPLNSGSCVYRLLYIGTLQFDHRLFLKVV